MAHLPPTPLAYDAVVSHITLLLTFALLMILACYVSFHHTYYVDYSVMRHNHTRTYYGDIPSILHVGGHQYVEVELAHLWRMQCVLAWCVHPSPGHKSFQGQPWQLFRTSMSNCARLYNVALSKNVTPPEDSFPFSFSCLVIMSGARLFRFP